MDKNIEHGVDSPEYEKYVHEEGGEWYMRLDDSSRGVKIPESTARTIILAFKLNKRRQSPDNMRTRGVYADINCHKTALYAIGAIDSDYDSKDSYGISFFPPEQYASFKSAEELEKHLRAVAGDSLWFVQCKESSADFAKPRHSFLAGTDEEGRVVCFEKVGANLHPFRITSLQTIYKDYKDGWWAGGPIESIKNHPLVRTMGEVKGPPPRRRP